MNIAKFLRTFLYKTPPVATLSYNYQSKLFQEIAILKFQGQHVLNPISVDMKIYALQQKQKSTAAGSNRILKILEQLLSEKEAEEEKCSQ